jgi:hypothetical protein
MTGSATKQSRSCAPELDCFAGARNDEAFSRRARVRGLLTTTQPQKFLPSRGKSRGRRSAERRIHPCPRIADKFPQSVQPVCARKRPDVGGRSPSGAPRRRLPKRPNASAQPRPRFTRRRGRRRYPRRRSRLSGAPRAPVVVPEGSMPEPPENGVTSPARRNRTRSINRPSSVTSLERTGIVPVT